MPAVQVVTLNGALTHDTVVAVVVMALWAAAEKQLLRD
jgi:hypothetical protein